MGDLHDYVVIMASHGKILPLSLQQEFKQDYRNMLFDKAIKVIVEGMKRDREEKERIRRESEIKEFYSAPFVEDVAEPYTGYKLLRVRVGNVHLGAQFQPFVHSIYGHKIWENGELVAVCDRVEIHGWMDMPAHEREDAPYVDCTCGIYAYKNVYSVIFNEWDPHKNDYRRVNSPVNSVVVELALGGYVFRHTNGYRAQIAKIKSIILVEDDIHCDSVVVSVGSNTFTYKDLAKIYNVPIKQYRLPHGLEDTPCFSPE